MGVGGRRMGGLWGRAGGKEVDETHSICLRYPYGLAAAVDATANVYQ